MKRILALLLSCALLLSGCGQIAVKPADEPEAPAPAELPAVSADTPAAAEAPAVSVSTPAEAPAASAEEAAYEPEFSDYSDEAFLTYVNDSIYAGLVDTFDSEDYIIENIESVYISQEYIDEVAYNSKANIFFGYTLEEIDAVYQDSKYVFTLGSDGTTVVKPFEDYDHTYEQIIRNVAIGTGVILVCVTVSVVAKGPVSLIFAASAEGAITASLSSSATAAIIGGLIEGVKTKDFNAALKAAALKGSEGFKCGAFIGALSGGAEKLGDIFRTTRAVAGAVEYAPGSVQISENLPSWRQSELRALNTYGGYEQLSYLNGQQVPYATPGATRPDIMRNLTDHLEAIEIKNYNLADPNCVRLLNRVLWDEVSARIENLPVGTTQRIVLDVTGRGFSYDIVNGVRDGIIDLFSVIYPNIPVDIIGMAA